MKIRKNDIVKMITGKDKGKTGKVLNIVPGSNKISVEGLNLKYKNARPRRGGEKGQRIMFPSLVDISNVMIVCPKCGRTARIGHRVLVAKSDTSREKKERICKKCSTAI